MSLLSSLLLVEDADGEPPKMFVFVGDELGKELFDVENKPPPKAFVVLEVLVLLDVVNAGFVCVFEVEKGLLGAAADIGG